MTNFSQYNLNEVLSKSLKNINFIIPTQIQEKAIPLVLQGNDILGSAQTGTGKTAAFCIPMIELLMRSNKGSALIMTPTRELAKQVSDVVHSLLGFKNKINTVSLIGGELMSKQLSQLKRRPRIFIGTPGRINDHLERGTLNLHDTNFLVLDETDRMLDMGFEVQINKILKFVPKKRQTLMFSATIPNNIIKLSAKYLNNSKRISMGKENIAPNNIKQEVIKLKSDEKLIEIKNQIFKREGSILVFVKTKYGTEKLVKSLSKEKIKSFALHGGLRQSKRNTVMKNFRDKKFRILIATDVAARGLDVPHIEHVINYDLPQMAEDFIHRIGRTARAGLDGVALSFVTKGDFLKWKEIQNILNSSKNNKSSQVSNKHKSLNRKKNNSNRNKKRFNKKVADSSFIKPFKKKFSNQSSDEKKVRKSFSKKRFNKKVADSSFKKPFKKKFSNQSSDEKKVRKSFSKKRFNKKVADSSFKKPFKKKFSNQSSDEKFYKNSDRSSNNNKPTRPRKRRRI